MGYNNTSTLKVITYPMVALEGMKCYKCYKDYPKATNYCQDDGEKLSPAEGGREYKEIIEIFRQESDVASFTLDNNGNESGEGSSDTILDDLIKFSKKYPGGLFQIDTTWDQGFGDPPSRFYVRNGMHQDCKLEMKYEEFSYEKLK